MLDIGAAFLVILSVLVDEPLIIKPASRDDVLRDQHGRNGMHKYNNQDHAMMTGMLSALNIMAGKAVYDVWRVNEDAEYSESGMSGAREALSSERLVPRKVA